MTLAHLCKTQEEVSKEMKQLQGAIDELERVSSSNPDPEPEKIDASELLKLIEHAKLYEQQNYTDASFSTLQQTINQTTVVDPDPELEVDTTELSKLISHAKTSEKDRYTASTYASLQQEISRAEVVIQTALTQEEIATATKQLQQVIAGLEKIVEPEPEPQPEVDTTELLKLISHAKTYEKGSYTVPTYVTLQQAINQAETVVQTATTQAEVVAEITRLQQAIRGLEVAIKPDPKPNPKPALTPEYKSESKLVPSMGDKENSKPEYNLDSKTKSNLGMNSKKHASKSSKSVDEESMNELESEENAEELDLEESFTDYEPEGEMNKSVTEDKSSNKTKKDFSWVFLVVL